MKRPLLALSFLVTGACSFQMHAQSTGTGTGASTGAAEPTPKPRKSHSGGGKSVSASFHKSGSISGKIDWQGRSGQLCRATAPFKFVGLAKFHGNAQVTPSGAQASGSGTASGKTSGGGSTGECAAPRTPVPTPPPAVAVKPHPEPKPVTKADARPELHAKSDSKSIPEKHSKSDSKTIPDEKPSQKPNKIDKKPKDEPTATPTPTPTPTPSTPTPEELETPKTPPAEPPDNVFGYDDPVLGCFEGQVFPLAANAPTLPTSYESLTPVSVVYACEWDIAPRVWDQGFPGIADRFEWFAIRYAGAFRTSAAGEYDFRLSSDDGSKLTIDGKLVIDNDGQHGVRVARGKVQLAAGDHQMVLEYFQGPRFHINLQLWVTPPGKSEELFTVR